MKVEVKASTPSLDLLAKKLANSQEFMALLGTAIRDNAQQRIKTTKPDPDGRAWAPWAESTSIARNRAGSAGFGLLFDKGHLYNSFVTTTTKNTVTVENVSPYAGFLQDGTPHMPARPFLGWGTLEDKAYVSIWNTWLTDIIKE